MFGLGSPLWSKFSRTSLSFDGVAEYVDCGTTPDMQFDGATAFSISSWVKVPAVVTDAFFSNVNGATLVGWQTIMFAGLPEITLNSGGATIRGRSVVPVTANVWQHIVWTCDGSGTAAGFLCYLNGVPVGTTTAGGPIAAGVGSTSPLLLGAAPGSVPAVFFTGLMDEVAIFPAVLSPAQAAAIYNGGFPTDLAPYAPLHWWSSEGASDGAGGVPDLGSGVAIPGTLTGGMTIDANRTSDTPP